MSEVPRQDDVSSAAERITRALNGEEDARAAIATEYSERIHRYIVTMIGDPNTADDLAQETFRRTFDQLHELRNPERLGPWIYTIAVNLCRMHLKRTINQQPQTLETEPAGARRSILSTIVRRESTAALAIAVDRLPILLREAFVLHLVEGLPYTCIAEITGATIEALHVRAHRAKALLRRQLGSVVDTFWSEIRGED